MSESFSKRGRPALSPAKVAEVRRLLSQGIKMRSVAEMCGVSVGAVHKIAHAPKEHAPATDTEEQR